MSEPEFDIDAAEQQYNTVRAEQQQDLPLEVEGEPGDADGNKPAVEPEQQDDTDGNTPPGFKSYEDYVAEGGDPDMYRGKKAFAAEHNRIDENKTLRREIKGLKGTVQQTMDAVSDWQTIERDKMRRDLEAELHTAKENEDVDGAINAKERLDKLDEKPVAPQQQEHPIIQGFRDLHPELDREAEEFNEEFNDDVEAFFNTMEQQLRHGRGKPLSDGQLKRCLKKAHLDARILHGDIDEEGHETGDLPPKESPRNQRKRGTQRPRRQQQTRQTPSTKAEDFKIENPKNGRDTSAAGVRDMIREKAYKSARKGGKSEEQATAFATQETKRFEESLAR